HETGVVSSVSVLVNAPGWTDAAQRLRDLSSPSFPELGVGLHLNLTTGRPVSCGGSLCDARTGQLHPFGTFVARARAGRTAPPSGSLRGDFTAGGQRVPAALTRGDRPLTAGHHRADGAPRLPGRGPRGVGRLSSAPSSGAGGAHPSRGSRAVPARPLPVDALRSAVANSSACITNQATRQGMPLIR